MTNPAYLDELLQLAGLLGADSAWLLRGPTEAQLEYFMPDDPDGDDPRELLVHRQFGPGPLPFAALLVARFPEADIAVPGVEELKLPPLADREIQVAALLSATLDVLTRIGPHATARIMNYMSERYGLGANFYATIVRDRRPQKPAPPAPAEPQPAPVETTRLGVPASQYKGIFVIRNADGAYWTNEGDWSKRRADAKVYKLAAWAERTARACGGTVEREE